MMNKINEIYTIENLPNISYVIPIYQRLFVWDKEQVNKLLNDLYEAFNAGKEKAYYIGIITVVEREDEENQKYWEVVDGQQRLTFLSLFGAMCCTDNSCWNDFLYTNKTLHHLRMKYIGRDVDEKDLSAIAKGEIDNIHNQNMRWFTECYNVFMLDKNEKLADFQEFVRTKATFMRSVLSSEYSNYELNLYFERINATGKQLEPQELVKSLHFSSVASLFNQLIDFSAEFKEKGDEKSDIASDKTTLGQILQEDEFNEELLKEPTPTSATSNERAIFSESTFLLHVLKLTCENGDGGNDVSLDQYKIIEIFEKKYSKGQKEDYIEKMKAYREWLDKNIIYISEDGYSFRGAKTEDGNTKNEKKDFLQYQSMLTVSSSDYQEWVLDAYIKSEGDKLTLETLKYLDKRELPELEDMCYLKINRYWFWKLDYLLWEKCHEEDWGIDTEIEIGDSKFTFTSVEIGAVKNYKFRPNRSIEHLHPQSSPSPFGNQLHSFGNLAMISKSFNSAQGNDDILIKFARLTNRIGKEQHLESIKLLLMFKLVGGNESEWTPETAKKHGEEMYEILKKEYRKECVYIILNILKSKLS